MSYRGYVARIEYDPDEQVFVGHLAGIDDVVGFHGDSVSELRRAFEESVDDYIETCRRLRRAPQRPLSGRYLLRMPPELHARASASAEALGQSLNEWIQAAMRKSLEGGRGDKGRQAAHQSLVRRG